MVTGTPGFEATLKDAVPRVLSALLRQDPDLDGAEDAVQEALLSAAVHWPEEGLPANPVGWLYTVAARRRVDAWRSEAARRRREMTATVLEPAMDNEVARDDALTLLFMCCHPSLQPDAQVALTLRAVGGLSTAQIASAFMLPEPTIARRITRAKQRVRGSGANFALPEPHEWAARLAAVMRVLYLIFNEGYATTTGNAIHRPDLTTEAIRLARDLHARLPDDGEATGLRALMLLADARREARTSDAGELVSLAAQDRSRWDQERIAEGIALVTWALNNCEIGPYQLEAAIAAVHCEAGTAADTDWEQIVGLYALLERLAPSPMVKLSRAVALAHADGPEAALAALDRYAADPAVARHYRHNAVRAHVLELLEQHDAAGELYRRAAQRTLSMPERAFLEQQSRRLETLAGRRVRARPVAP